MLISILKLPSAAVLLALSPMVLTIAAHAQSRDAGGSTGAAAGAGPTRDAPVKTPATVPLPPLGTPGDGQTPDLPGTPSRGDGGGSTAGLPDAVTILNILWSLPHRGANGPSGSSDYGPPARGPQPKSGRPETNTAPPPPPTLLLAAGTPFVPKPLLRPAADPPALAGSIVPETRQREVIVSLNAGSDAALVAELARDLGLQGDTLYASALLGTRVARFRIPDARSIADVVQQLSRDSRVEVVQPNYVFTASGAAATLPVPQYATQKLRLDDAHKLARGKRVKIAVIDTGIDAGHPVFAGSVHDSFNALTASKAEAENHGTSIAGIAAARSGFIGVAPDSEVLTARAFTAQSTGPAQSDTLAVLKSLDWAVMRGARVINMSFAGPEDPLLGRAIAAAVKQGAIVIAAAGNGGPDATPAYPAAFAGVIAVSATDSSDKLYAQANRGAYIAIAAPGVDIVAPAVKGAFDISSGTSLAAAHVSGIAALILEREPKLTPNEVRARLISAAHNPGRLAADSLGAGIIDAADAVGGK